MQLLVLTLGLVLVLLGRVDSVVYPTPLQTYVAKSDPSYSYTLATTVAGADTTTYVLKLTSQRWLTDQDVNPSLWQHWFQIVVPNNLEESTQSGIYVDGGGDSPDPPTSQDVEGVMLAVQTKMIMGHLYQIPNEPTIFLAEGKGRSEDAFLAYTWAHFLNDTTQPEWVGRLPMVKAVVRAMDAMQDFVSKLGHTKPEKFVIAGASKRGWVTWLTPAVDTRVNAIVPMVMPILNMVDVINQMWRSLGLWTFAFKDYTSLGLLQFVNDPSFQELADIIDPVNYMPYIEKLPKYMVFSTGDEFFLPDSTRNFYEQSLLGPKYLRMVPNTEHSLAPLDQLVVENIGSFVNYVKHGDTIPGLTEKIIYSNTTASITVWPSQPPDEVKMWVAYTTSPNRRDFRLIVCTKLPDCFQPVIWSSTDLTANADGSYTATTSAPLLGFAGFVIEVSYKSKYGTDDWYSITSQVVIVPDIYPFAPCGNNCGQNATYYAQEDYLF